LGYLGVLFLGVGGRFFRLLFKNIKIAHKKVFSFEFFAPFNFLFFEEKQKWQTKT
jgi:hypothetical protein